MYASVRGGVNAGRTERLLSEREGQGAFDPAEYWQKRLTASYSLGSVGWSSLGEEFNEWSYAVRRRVFTRVAARRWPGAPTRTCWTSGREPGFYLDLWQRLGVAHHRQRSDRSRRGAPGARFPGATIERVDIGEAEVPFPQRAYDVISIVDVLFHIVDDARYRRALSNLAGLLKPGGTLILSENLVPRQSRATHQVTRRGPRSTPPSQRPASS